MGKFLEIALEILFLYFLYRLIFDFIIPIYRSSRKVHQHMREMQQRMQDQMRQQQRSQAAPPQPQPPPREAPKQVDGEYIEYEEVK